MPNRILRDWTNSERFDELSIEAEIFFVRLIMKADDYGCYHGNTKLLKSHLYPLKDFNHVKIDKWIRELVRIEAIIFYKVEGKNFIKINEFGQRLRTMKSKFPQPEESCQTNDGQLSDNCRLEVETEVEVEVEYETEKKKASSTFNFKKELINLNFDVNLVDDWLKVRKAKRSANTATALKGFLREVVKSGIDQNEILRTCVENSWSGFKASWIIKTNNNEKSNTTTREERNESARLKLLEETINRLHREQ